MPAVSVVWCRLMLVVDKMIFRRLLAALHAESVHKKSQLPDFFFSHERNFSTLQSLHSTCLKFCLDPSSSLIQPDHLPFPQPHQRATATRWHRQQSSQRSNWSSTEHQQPQPTVRSPAASKLDPNISPMVPTSASTSASRLNSSTKPKSRKDTTSSSSKINPAAAGQMLMQHR